MEKGEIKALTVQFYEAIHCEDGFGVDFDEAWDWVGYSTKGNAKRILEQNFTQDADYQIFIINDKNPQGGRPSEQIRLSSDCFKSFCMLAQTARGKEVRRYFIECEKVFRKLIPQTTKLAQLENRQTLIEAAVVNHNPDFCSLSGYYRLRGQRWNLDSEAAKAMGRRVRKASEGLGYEVLKTHDAKYGQVNTYHVNVLQAVLGF
jgi:phage anti-repressor protein